ncbi:MAG: hypothetical protein ABQ298_02395 [Puniceicoccaceae bacterium]
MNNSNLYNGAFEVFREHIARSFPSIKVPETDSSILDKNYFLVDSPRFNASVSASKNNSPRYYFNLGIHLAVFDAVSTLVGISDFYKEVPFDLPVWVNTSIGRLRDRCTDYRFLFEGRSFKGSVAGISFSSDNPEEIDSSSRGRLGNFLSELCFKFISFHEQAHFNLGHVNLAKEEFGVARLHEAPDEHEGCGIEGDPVLIRCLELEADAQAISTFFASMPGRGRFKPVEKGVSFRDAYQVKTWIKCVIYSAMVIVAILSLIDDKFKLEDDKREHPFALTRLINILDAVDYNLHFIIKTKEERNSYMSSINDDINVIFGIFGLNLTMNVDAHFEGTYLINGQEYEKEIYFLNNFRNRYKKLLDKHRIKS